MATAAAKRWRMLWLLLIPVILVGGGLVEGASMSLIGGAHRACPHVFMFPGSWANGSLTIDVGVEAFPDLNPQELHYVVRGSGGALYYDAPEGVGSSVAGTTVAVSFQGRIAGHVSGGDTIVVSVVPHNPSNAIAGGTLGVFRNEYLVGSVGLP